MTSKPPGHAWMPSSPCDTGCLPTDSPTAGTLRRTVRGLGLLAVAVLAFGLSVVARGAPGLRPYVQRWTVSGLLRCCGVRLRVQGGTAGGGATAGGERTWGVGGRAVLVVAQHVSWLDALALLVVAPVSLVARADLVGWPVLGAAARWGRTVFIDRAALRELPGVVDQVATALRAGRATAVFAEGTTWCGTARGRFRPALLQAAVDAGVDVVPVALRYTGPDGFRTAATAFVGEETFADSLRRIIGLRGVTVEITVLAAEAPGLDRRELAARCTAAVERVSAGPLPPLRVRVPEHQRSHQVSISAPRTGS